MPARGPHDDLATTRRVFEQISEALSRGDIDAAEALADREVEFVTRDGVLHGPSNIRFIWGVEFEKWDVDFKIDDVVDAGDGAAIVLMTVDRRNKETAAVELRAWPGLVIRVNGGKLVFLEGYVDSRKAFDDLGLERPTGGT